MLNMSSKLFNQNKFVRYMQMPICMGIMIAIRGDST